MILHVIFDLDGVVYRGTTPMPHVSEAVAALREKGGRVAFFTNNATGHRRAVAGRLNGLGIAASPEEVKTSASATAQYVAETLPERRAFVVGEQGLVAELVEAGVEVCGAFSPRGRSGEAAGVVVVALDRYVTWHKLRQAHQAILNGAAFIATNPDPSFPDTPTTTAPAAGSLVAALRASTGVEPTVIGKPETAAFEQIAAAWGVGPEEIAAVGDRIDTDVVAARRFGCRSILVLTGITSQADLARLSKDGGADRVIEDLSELMDALESLE